MNVPSPIATLAFLQNIGWMEMLVIMVLLLLLFGRRLPEVGKSLGKGIVEFKKGVKGIEDDVEWNNSRPQQNYPQQPFPQQNYPQQHYPSQPQMTQYPAQGAVQGQAGMQPGQPQGLPAPQPGYQGQTYPAQSPWTQQQGVPPAPGAGGMPSGGMQGGGPAHAPMHGGTV